MVNKPDTFQFPVVDPATGEYMILVKRKKVSTASNERFIKFYLPLINILHNLNKTDLLILQYIAVNLPINKSKPTLLITHKLTGLNRSTFYKSIQTLTDYAIISKTNYINIYSINKTMLHNGRY